MRFFLFPLYCLLLLPAIGFSQHQAEGFQGGFTDGSAQTVAFITQSLQGCEYGLASGGTDYASGYDPSINPSSEEFVAENSPSFDPEANINSILPGAGINSYTTQCTDPLRAYLVQMASIIDGRISAAAPFSLEWLYWTGYRAGHDFAAVRWL